MNYFIILIDQLLYTLLFSAGILVLAQRSQRNLLLGIGLLVVPLLKKLISLDFSGNFYNYIYWVTMGEVFLAILAGLYFLIRKSERQIFLGIGFLLYALNLLFFTFLPRIDLNGLRDIVLYSGDFSHYGSFLAGALILTGTFILNRNAPSSEKASQETLTSFTGISIPAWLPLFLYVLGTVSILVTLGIIQSLYLSGDDPLLIGIIILLASSYVVAGVLILVQLYQVWRKLIFLGQLKNSPVNMKSAGQAVGFLFIPLFNVYWIFVALSRASSAVNRLAGRTVISPALAPLIPLSGLLALLPFEIAGGLSQLLSLSLYTYFIYQINKALGNVTEVSTESGEPQT